MATKKISELPLATALSGSQVDGGSVVPVVIGGTTNQISVENFSKFATAYSATTASNTFIGNQNITGNVNISGVETVTGTLNVVGGGSVSGDFSIGGKLTVQELHTEVTSASILFESGSTILGNTSDDTHTVTGTIVLNGQALGTGQLNAFTGSLISQTTLLSTFTSSVNLATASLNLQTGSQDLVNRRISSTTGSINTTTSSFDSVFQRISSTTGSINTTTSSFNSVFLGISSVTGAMNTQSSSQDLVNLGISTYTGSQNIINTSVDSHILKQAIQTGSQDLVNLGISTYTGSNETWKSGVRDEISSIEAWTSSLDSTYATDAQLTQLYVATASLNLQTGSQNIVNFNISKVTASIDAHILKQSTQSGSQDLVNLGISTYTGSQNVINSSVDSHILKQAIQTGSQDLVNLGISTITGSLIGITNGLMAFTAALDNTYATDAQLYQLYQATASLNIQTGSQYLVNLGISTYTGSQNIINTSVDSHILKQAIQTGSQDLVNLAISTYTGSNELWKDGIRGEVSGLEAYTASLKGAIVVSGTNVEVMGTLTAQEIYTTYVTSSVMYQSGSTKFGDSIDDMHQFTGSLNLTGSNVYLQDANFTIAKQAIGSTTVVGNINFRNDYAGAYDWARIQAVNGSTHDFSNIAFSTWNGFNTLTEVVRITSNGNLNVNNGNIAIDATTTPSCNEGAIFIGSTNSTNIGSIGSVSNYTNNAYYNGSTWKYINSAAASNYYQGSGGHTWRVAATGTAGNDITWKDAFSINSSGQLTNTVSGSNGQFILYQQQASYNTDAMSYFHNNANASTGWNFLKMFSGYPDNTQDIEFVFRGDGNAYADTGWTTPASDYAEYFESLNGEALPVGSTVVLVDNKIKVATESDTNIIGVIRPKGAALFLGNNEAQKWNGKYLKDDYGAYILDENGHRTLNPNYDSTITYVSRENRVEWNVVGLIGQVPITKGQPVNSNWIKMKDISSNVEEWLIK